MAAAMTDHIQNNPFGRSTDGHRDDCSAVQIGGSARGYQTSLA
jgi:ABC-type branched-subunit amino acid transport system permease subunit